MTTHTFEPWPKIARLNRNVTVTEKIDGTNAAVVIGDDLSVAAQSRKRLITPEDDNYGFAKWVAQHAESLGALLGPGRHFGEWWGSGIQRGYGLTKGDKRFSLFNTARYGETDFSQIPGMGVVPALYEGPFAEFDQDYILNLLRVSGSFASPGFMDPEGIIVFHQAAKTMFKVTLKNDEVPKALAS